MSTPPPPEPFSARRRSPLTVVLIVLGSLVGLVVLAVVGLLAWAQFRPLLAADYSLANNRVGTLGEQLNFVGEAVGAATTVLPQGNLEAVGGAAQSMRDQVGLAEQAAQELSEVRAVSDPEVERQVAAIQAGTAQLQTYVRSYADALVPLAEMNVVCAQWAQAPETEVTSGATLAELDAAVADCEQRATELSQGGEGAWTELAGAQLVLVEGTREAFGVVESDPEDFDAQLTAQRAAREDYEQAVLAANTALADELAEQGSVATDPVNELGRYTQQQAER